MGNHFIALMALTMRDSFVMMSLLCLLIANRPHRRSPPPSPPRTPSYFIPLKHTYMMGHINMWDIVVHYTRWASAWRLSFYLVRIREISETPSFYDTWRPLLLAQLYPGAVHGGGGPPQENFDESNGFNENSDPLLCETTSTPHTIRRFWLMMPGNHTFHIIICGRQPEE